MTNPVRVNLHVAASNAASLHGFFNQSGQADSHFYVRKDGSCDQMVDTSLRAFADLQGNPDTISIETQGGVSNPESEKWTPAQVETIAKIFAWAHQTHKIPLRQAKDSKPGSSSHGLSWHRLGIQGNFPSSWPLYGIRSGGLKYSNHFGKVCPGSAKIKQIAGILTRASAIVGGSPDANKMLKALGYDSVVEAQEDLNLVKDGVAGSITIEALEKEMSKLDKIAADVAYIRDKETKTNNAVGRIEPVIKALAGLGVDDDLTDAKIDQILKRVEQNNSAIGRMEKVVGTYGQKKG